MPEIADAAMAGALSEEQLAPVVQLADESNAGEWAARAPNISPPHLRRVERTTRECTPADEAARREARALHWWMRDDAGMLSLRGDIPGVDGVLVKQVLDDMVEHMKPAKGQPLTGHARCDGRGIDRRGGVLRRRHPVRLRARAHHDPRPAPPGINARDRHCRWPGCERTDTELHHLIPVSEGGLTEPGNLVPACRGATGHHIKLEPHGPYRLVGNPNLPDGLTLVDTRTGAPVGAGEPLSRAGPPP